MPISKHLEDLVVDLKKAQSSENLSRINDILEQLEEERDLNLEFMVSIAGPVVKALRTQSEGGSEVHPLRDSCGFCGEKTDRGTRKGLEERCCYPAF